MTRSLKIVVTGPFNAGKTRFIQTISDIDVVSTERRITARAKGMKAQTTVAMDYGRVQLGDDVLHLHGTPGQARFDFMWEILAREMAGLVLLADASAPDTFDEARELLTFFAADGRRPHVVAANKQDAAGAASPDKVRRALGLTANTLVMPCVAGRKTSVRQVLAQLADMIPA
jgi:signal recognition particle receptor subunit beta